MEFQLKVNGAYFSVDVDPNKPLLHVLREDLDVMGPKYCCGVGLCGACMVLIDGKKSKSCLIRIESLGQQEVTTIEGLNDDLGRALKKFWLAEAVSQCGYCQPGQIMAAYHLLKHNAQPSDAEIEESITNLCRCGTYQRIKAAIRKTIASRNL
jgi:isoquinoline 1-oxidoreductase alpha subunit